MRALASLLALLTLLAAPALLSTGEAARVDYAGALSTGLVGPGAVLAEDAVYTFGGRVPDAFCETSTGEQKLIPRFVSDVIRFDPETGDSESVANFHPIAGGSGGREAGAAVWDGSEAYVFGGAVLLSLGDNDGDGCEDLYVDGTADVVQFNPLTRKVTNLAEDLLPEAAWGASAIWAGDAAFVYGGVGITAGPEPEVARKDWILRFDPGAPPGERLTRLAATLPFEVQDAAIAHVGGRTYLFGGLATHTPGILECPEYVGPANDRPKMLPRCPSDRILVHDLAAGTVEDLSMRLPGALQFAAAAATSDGVYVLGGRRPDGSATGDVLLFDPETETIRNLPPTLPGGRYAPGVAARGDDVYLAGGKTAAAAYLPSVARLVPGATEPWPPMNLTATGVTIEGATLAWEPPAYDGGSAVTGYAVYRGTPHERPVRLRHLGAEARSYMDDAAAPGTRYTYVVTSVSDVSESPTGASAAVRTLARAPDAPRSFGAYGADNASLLRWSAPGSDGGDPVSAYRVYRNGSLLAETSALELVDDEARNGVSYEYELSAVNAEGESPRAGPVRATPAPVPPPPTGLWVTAVDASLHLGWTPPPVPVLGYHVYRGDAPGSSRCYGEATGFGGEGARSCLLVMPPSFNDSSVERGRRYWYNVTAVGPRGASPPTPHEAGAVLVPPGAPLDLTATPGPGEIVLEWEAPADDGGGDVLAYTIVRATGEADPVTFHANATRFTDRNVSAGETHRYAVLASNPLAGPRSGEAEAIPLPPNARPVARLTASPVDVAPGRVVTFDASTSRDPDGRVVEYGFSFGDGTAFLWTGTPRAPHAYRQPGVYTVTLTVRDELGAESEPDALRLPVGGASGRDAVLRPLQGAPGEAPGKGIPDVLSPLALAGAAAAVRTGARRTS